MDDFITRHAKRVPVLSKYLRNFFNNLTKWIKEDDLRPVEAHSIVSTHCMNILFHYMEAHDLKGEEGLEFLERTLAVFIEVYKEEYFEKA
jgi:hypothetical protein